VEQAVYKLPYGKFHPDAPEVEAEIRAKHQARRA